MPPPRRARIWRPPVLWRRLAVGAFVAAVSGPALLHATSLERSTVLAAMKRAATFMEDRVSCGGGYVWTYLPDLSRRWGELEATPTMIWMQSGTAAMGEGFLDAFHATGDDFYYDAAARVGDALIAAQHPSGGWNYVFDFAGEESLRNWYATIGRNAWRLEEFQSYCGNATFDDQTTADAARFLLRLHVEKRAPRFRAALDRTIAFVLAAQYPMGGWPQRFPPAGASDSGGAQNCPPYASHVTLNDRVATENLDFLLHCFVLLDDGRLAEPIHRGMRAFLLLQQPAPQAGWAMQYNAAELQPAAGRSYEPAALATNTTCASLDALLRFHELTGDPQYLEPFPAAFTWLESVQLPAASHGGEQRFPTFVAIGTNRALYLHRTGSNVVNGRYFADHDPAHPVGHYASVRSLDLRGLRERYARAVAGPAPAGERREGLRVAALPRGFPRYHAELPAAFLERYGGGTGRGTDRSVQRVLAALNAEGYWPTVLRFTSHPHTGDGAVEIPPGDFAGGFVGDASDTSPFAARDPAVGISIASYLRNMSVLIRWLDTHRD